MEKLRIFAEYLIYLFICSLKLKFIGIVFRTHKEQLLIRNLLHDDTF